MSCNCIQENGTIRINGNHLEIFNGQYSEWEIYEINFCPFCGEPKNDNNTIESCQNDQKSSISSYNFITMENGRQNDENNAT